MLDIISSGAAWISFWEAVKFFFSRYLAGKSEKNSRIKVILQRDLQSIQDSIAECLELTVKYYTDESSDLKRKSDATKIRHLIKAIGYNFNTINIGLNEIEHFPLDKSLMIAFRKAVTTNLDQAAWKKEEPEGELLSTVCRSCYYFESSIARITYSAAT